MSFEEHVLVVRLGRKEIYFLFTTHKEHLSTGRLWEYVIKTRE